MIWVGTLQALVTPPPMFAELKSRALVRLSGPETRAFLQGLLSNDVTGDGAIFAALLSPQGKIQFDLIVWNGPDETLIDCEDARADELVAKLKLYRLRAKIDISRDNRAVFALWGASAPQRPHQGTSGLIFDSSCMDPRCAALGARRAAPAAQARTLLKPLMEADEAEYIAHRLALGVPEGARELNIEKLFLLEANAEELHGVDFQKGCYVGQELTSRMKRKMELKKRLLPLAIAGEAAPGANVIAGEEILGQVIGGAPSTVFALLRLDRLADARASRTPLRVGDAPAELQVPVYLAGKL